MADAAPRINTPKAKDRDKDIEDEVARELKERRKAERHNAHHAAKHKAGSDDAKPLRMAGNFVQGTVLGLFDGAALGGRYGLLAGIAATIVACYATPVVGALFPTFLIGVLPMIIIGGIALGAAGGLLVGGANRVAKGEDDEARARGGKPDKGFLGMTYHEVRDEDIDHAEVNFDRLQQQMRIEQHDDRHYWRDQVSGRDDGWMKGF